MSKADYKAAMAKLLEATDELELKACLKKVDRYVGELRRKAAVDRATAEERDSAVAQMAERLQGMTQVVAAADQQVAQHKQTVRDVQRSAKEIARDVDERPQIDGSHALVSGVQAGSPSPAEFKRRVKGLKKEVAYYLPDFVRAVSTLKRDKVDLILSHQDAFAGDYWIDEFTLCGMAVKYAGLHGITVTIHGTNGETFTAGQ